MMRLVAITLAALLAAPAAWAGSMGAGSLPTVGLSFAQAQAVAAPARLATASRAWHSVIPFWGPVAASYNNASAMTYGADFSVEGPFTAVQLILANRGTAAVTVSSLAVAASSQLTDPVTPHDANGNGLTFVPVTCGGATTCTLAPSASATREQLTLSDVIPLTSLPRTDGGAYPLVFTRITMPANTAYSAGVVLAASMAAYNAIPGVRPFAAYWAGGDFTGSTAVQPILTVQNATQSADYNVVVGVRYLSPRDIVDVMSCGDSLAAGFQTASGYNSHGLQATIALAQRTGRGISYIAHGFPGTVDTDYLADCAQGVSLLQPQVVEFPSDSPNDLNAGVPGSPAIIAAQAAMPANALAMMNTVLGAGDLPVIETPIPFGAYDTAAKYGVLRQTIGSIVRGTNARGAMMLDAQAIISGYVPSQGNLQTLPPSCLASDNAHLNDACQTMLGLAEASLLAPALR